MIKHIVILFACISLMSCGDEETVLFEKFNPVNSEGWVHNDTISFEFDATDSLKRYDFNLRLRTEKSYPYANLYLFILTEFPNGKSAFDTLSYMLADPSGKWYGKSTGSLIESEITYKRTTIPYKGHYKMNVIQAMREETLYGVSDIGLKIIEKEKS